jgi:hypothetical protein
MSDIGDLIGTIIATALVVAITTYAVLGIIELFDPKGPKK